MKNNDKKGNQRLRSVLLLLLATGVVIALVSSTAIKLASATYLMQKTKKPVIELPQVVQDFVQTIIPSATPSNTNSGSSSNTTANKPAVTTAAPTTTKPATTAPSTSKPTTTASEKPSTTAPTTATTAPAETVDAALFKKNHEIFNSYKSVVNNAKTKNHTFTKKTERKLDMSFFQSIWVSNANDIKVNDEKYFDNPIEVIGSTADKAFVINNKNACLLSNDFDVTKAAIKSAEKKTLSDGTVKLVIAFNDYKNPKPLADGDKTADNFISAVFPVVSAEQVRATVDEQCKTYIESIDLTYSGCSVELIYNPVSGDIVSLTQVVKYTVDAKDGYKSLGGTVTETNTYTF